MRSRTTIATAALLATVSSAMADDTDAPLDALISRYASAYAVPEALVHRIVKRESGYRPAARNGRYLGLMQISHATAKTMGYDGPAAGLLDAETNLRYAVKYLAGAYMVADGDANGAVRFYSRGYYYDAKRKGLLEETGLKPGAAAEITGSIEPVSIGGLY